MPDRARAPTEPEILEAIESLQRLAEAFAERRGQLARGAGLTEAQWRLLEQVEGGEFLPSLFARQRACTPAAVSRGLRQLLELNLVQAAIGAEDGRQRIYRLTAQGRRALAKLRRSRARAIETVWRPLGKQKLADFNRFARELADRLEAYARTR